MEDSFRVRVDRTFGPLSSSSSSSQTQTLTSSLWSLTDDEIQKQSWNRDAAFLPEAGAGDSNDTDDDDDGPFPSSVDRLFSVMKSKLAPDDEHTNPNPNPRDYRQELEEDIKELDDDAGEGTSGGSSEPGSNNALCETVEDKEVVEVRNAVGMDCTLDFEEEEDVHDKVAVGDEKSGDRLYMGDVTDYVPDFYSYSEIPNTFDEISRDPRANHEAAKLRLKEDADTARSFNSLQVSEPAEAVIPDSQNNTSENGTNLKSILKRKEDHMVSRSEKRVRFEPSCKSSDEVSEEQNLALPGTSNGEITLREKVASTQQDSSSVPGYIRNPSKYTHYTFDSSDDMNEESNRHAYMDFLNILKKSKQSDPEEEVPADLSKPVVFNPKKKTGQDSMSMTSNESNLTKDTTMGESMHKKKFPVSFSSEGLLEDETSEMEVDKQTTGVPKGGSGHRTCRRYRAKQSLESHESPDG